MRDFFILKIQGRGKTELKSTKEKGFLGEEKAVSYLVKKGYRILERNFRTREGEIDIIAFKGEILVFVEVKSLPKGNIEVLSHELNSKKCGRIIKTAKIYLQKYRQYINSLIRFDVLAIDVPGLEPVYHIENAFWE